MTRVVLWPWILQALWVCYCKIKEIDVVSNAGTKFGLFVMPLELK